MDRSVMKKAGFGVCILAFLLSCGVGGNKAEQATQTAAAAMSTQASYVLETSAALAVTVEPTAEPEPQAGDVRVRETDGMQMVYVPAGEFERGSDIFGNEGPILMVYLDEYWIDKYEVSNAQFEKFIRSSGYKTDAEKNGSGRVYTGSKWEEKLGADWRHPSGAGSDLTGKENHPVVQVNWNDASAYCEWVGGRLPTEAEWEKAARGTDGRRFPWGNTFDGMRLNYADMNTHFKWSDTSVNDGYADTAPVGSYPEGASPYGALDMAGNVQEWVADWHGEYSSVEVRNPIGPSSGEERVLRGGAWDCVDYSVRTSVRGAYYPDLRSNNSGFRCVRSGF